MKKLLYLFSATLLLLTSCSKDNPETNGVNVISANLILPKQIDTDGDISTMTYNGNKIVQVVSGNEKVVYTYTGNLITKEESFEDNVSNHVVVYDYQNDKLKTSTYTENEGTIQYKGKTQYVHNADGIISYSKYNIDATTNVATLNYTGTYTFSNGNLVKDMSVNNTEIYEYDTKNSPFKNILGLDKLLELEFSSNNVVKVTHTSSSSATPSVSTYEYIYNSDGFPTEEKTSNYGTTKVTAKYTY